MTNEVSKYFAEKYKNASFDVVPGHWPDFKSKDDVDKWIKTMEEIMSYIDEDQTNIICPKCKKENKKDGNFCVYCGSKIKEECNCWMKKKVYNCGLDKCPGHRLHILKKYDAKKPEITWDYGILDKTARVYITTDKSFYDGMKENPNFVPMFTPEAMIDLKTKETYKFPLDFYVFRILESK